MVLFCSIFFGLVCFYGLVLFWLCLVWFDMVWYGLAGLHRSVPMGMYAPRFINAPSLVGFGLVRFGMVWLNYGMVWLFRVWLCLAGFGFV